MWGCQQFLDGSAKSAPIQLRRIVMSNHENNFLILKNVLKNVILKYFR
jgi:hypothetical protein